MKKLSLIIFLVITLGLVGCSSQNASNNSDEGQKSDKIIVGASPIPHAQILNLVKDDLKAEGVELVVKEISDYNIPNEGTATGELDANFFQHKPYLDTFNAKGKAKLVPLTTVHIEPMGAYSSKIKSIDELKDGATIAVPNDPSNEARALLLLQREGIIKLKSETDLAQTPKDIVENPKNIKFNELEGAYLPRALSDVDIAIINTNLALEGNLNPKEDTLFMEDKSSPYANILVAKEDRKDDEVLQKLVKALNSEKVRKFIEEEYKGEVIPAF